MKTLADVKRRLTPGTLLATRYLSDEWGKGDPPVRAFVGGVTSLRMEACDWSNGQESHWHMPKASEIEITGPDSFIVNPGSVSAREYTFVTERQASDEP